MSKVTIALMSASLLLLAQPFLSKVAQASSHHSVSSSVQFSLTIPSPTGNIRFTGYASPHNLVTFLRNGMVMGTQVANASSYFDKTFTGLNPGVYNFGIYASDQLGRLTATVSFDATVISGSTVTLGHFLLPPTVNIQKNSLRRPDTQISDGYGRNNAIVTAFFNSHGTLTKQVETDHNGRWEAKVSETFHLGSHSMNSLIQDSHGHQSILSQTIPFTVILSADLNVDNLVNLTDFSILMFNYGLSNPPNLAADINDNGPVDLIDFSVMMYHWTGG